MSGGSDLAGQPPPVSEISARILAAARECFERFGIRKTTIGDIAEAAGVSRPTVYKNFASKEAILDTISIVEIGRVHEALRKRLRRHAAFEERLTEILLVSAQVAMENSYVRWFLQEPDVRLRSQAPDSELSRATRERWRHLFETASAAGDIADDISFDEMVFWLTLAQESLVFRLASAPIEEERLRRLIRRFVVEPLLAPVARTTKTRKRAQDH